MKKKLLLCAALGAIGVAAVFAGGCFFMNGNRNDDADEHEHDYSYSSDYNDTHHWYGCECGDKYNFEEHDLSTQDTNNGLRTYCHYCGYEYVTKYSPEECGRHNYVFNRTTIEATCTTPGETEFICTRCDDIWLQYEDATYHDYEEVWTWNGYESATVMLICKNDNSHVVENLVAEVKHTVRDAGCFEDGADIYRASIYYYHSNHSDEKRVVIPQIGHHAYVDEYTHDRQEHWHAPTCRHKEEIKDKGEHTFVSGVCSTCGYEEGSSPQLSFTLNEDGVSYSVGNGIENEDKFVVIPATHNGLPVTTMERDCFANNKILSIVIPNTVTEIDQYAIYYCGRLVEIYNLSDVALNFDHGRNSAIKIHTSLEEESIIKVKGDFVFATDEAHNKEYLIDYWGENTRVILPDNDNQPYQLHDYCFYGYNKIEHIELSDYVTIIGHSAFYQYGIKTIVISQSVTAIYSQVFKNTAVRSVYYKGTEEQWNAITNYASDELDELTLYFYSATQPEEEGNFWCYEDDGHTIKVW